MNIVELNPPGNFGPWDQIKLDELKNPPALFFKHGLLFENDTMRLWEISLKPRERLPFHKTEQNYSWTCLTDGLAITRVENGSVHLLKFKKGETHFWDLGYKGTVMDFENIGEKTLVLTVIEYIPQEIKVPQNILASR